ncbi:MAG: ATP-dependent Clp protease ATP-binding subunit ClpX [Lachnospiraceae bacterium]|nr:ATP-dependent Clp protease ATP-binding subunit ClpX [Lachnospiraceae bacterium]
MGSFEIPVQPVNGGSQANSGQNSGGSDSSGQAGAYVQNSVEDPGKNGDSENPDDDKNTKDKNNKKNSQGPIQGVHFINLADLMGGDMAMPRRQKVKKKKENTEPKKFDRKEIPAPHRLKAMLDEYVIGQEKAKKTLSVAVYNHYKRVCCDPSDGVEIEKSNVLLLGPTGSGKTYLVKTLAKLLDVPLAIADATSLTEAGYIGDDIESVVGKLLAAADNDVEKAEHGIVYIDEIDKIAKKKQVSTRDVSGESVQQELLKMLEGAEVEVPVGSNSKNGMVPMMTVDTTNILFICGGAFPDLEEIVKERLTTKSSIGFQAELKGRFDNEKNLLLQANMDDLRKFGMIPEFLGRLPVLVALEELTKEMLVQILKEPKNAILKQYKKLMAMDEVKLEFEDEALGLIAEKALEKHTGARALRAILEEYMLDIMYQVPKDSNIGKVTITRAYLENTGGPRIELRGQIVPELPGV